MNRYLSIAGGLLISISMFLPFFSLDDISLNGMTLGGVAWFYVVVGLVVAIVGFADKRWLNILSLLIGLLVAALAMKYSGDATAEGGKAGIGIWILMLGGVLSAIGSVMGMIKKKVKPATT